MSRTFPILLHGSPELVAGAIDGGEHLIYRPPIPGPGKPSTKLVGIVVAEFATPLADGFIGRHDAALKEQYFDATIAQTEAEVELDAMAAGAPENLRPRERVTLWRYSVVAGCNH
jgi:hypothetical protein